MGTDHFAKSSWQVHLKRNMVIVCTAEILYQCLSRSFVQLDQINLLIFDEAHHAKKSHPYARIIKDFYITEPPSKRPKVFGMTASPVDVRSDFAHRAKELEAMLHCQIATVSDLSMLQSSVSRPKEIIAVYSTMHSSFQTILCQEMEARFGDLEALRKIFRNARDATIQLGAWCADHVWSLAMSERAALKFERKIQEKYTSEQYDNPMEMMDAETALLHEAQAFVRAWMFEEPAVEAHNLSHKVTVLLQYLNFVFERPTEARCIVFVRERYIAQLLCELFACIGPARLRPSALTGCGNGNTGELEINFYRQLEIIKHFKDGRLNCLVMPYQRRVLP